MARFEESQFILAIFNYNSNIKKEVFSMHTINTFGTRLRELRENNNLSQLEMANSISCSRKSLSNYELGMREPDFDMLIRICDFFNITIDFLLGRTDIPKRYKEMDIDSKTEKLLYYFDKLPEQYKDDVIRYTKFNMLEAKEKEYKPL